MAALSEVWLTLSLLGYTARVPTDAQLVRVA